MTNRARVFLTANAESPVVYGGVEGHGPPGGGQAITYRLANDRTFRLTPDDLQHVGEPRWAHHG